MGIRYRPHVLLLLFAAVGYSCTSSEPGSASNVGQPKSENEQVASLHTAMKQIEPFFKPMGKPLPHDWLDTYKEPGQTFDEYIESNATLPTAERKTIYVQPLGRFTAEQNKVIKITSEYIEAFYGLPVKTLAVRSLPTKLDKPDQRTIDYPQHRQLRTGYILEKILQPALPKEAAALIAFTDEDLYPDTSMFFVFGQASLENRVGVWSLFRLDDHANFDTFLRRTMKIAVHEVGHMFSFRHCTKYECVMSGTNHLGETDRRPIDACPECMAKIAWMTNEKPKERYKRLEGFSLRNGMKVEAAEFKKKEKAVD